MPVNVRSSGKVIFCTIMSCMLCVCACCRPAAADEKVAGSDGYGNVYEITEFLDEEHYNEYMTDDGTLYTKLIDFIRLLDDSPEMDFCSYASNCIEVIGTEIPETCVVNHGTADEDASRYIIDGESITAAEAIQVSDGFSTLFPLGIVEGRGFGPTDREYTETDVIPVILGSAYNPSFDVGDTFEGYYICERRSFKVIGFTDDISFFYERSRNDAASYADRIIMPFGNSAEDTFAARAVMLQRVCGYIMPVNGRDSAVLAIGGYLDDVGLGDWKDEIMVNEMSLQYKTAGRLR